MSVTLNEKLSRVDCLSSNRKQAQMAGGTQHIFPSGLWETSTCQAFPIPLDVSTWQHNTTNYADPSLGLDIPNSLERILLGQAKTFSPLPSAAHPLFYDRAFIAYSEKLWVEFELDPLLFSCEISASYWLLNTLRWGFSR